MTKSLARQFNVAILLLGTISGARAAELPTGLDKVEIRKVGRLLARSASHRPWTASAIEGEQMGLEVGFEGAFALRREVLDLGDRNGVVPRVIPIPRFWLGADLPHELQFSASYSPGTLYDGVHQIGTALQWTYWRQSDYAFSTLFSYTYANLFGDLTMNNFAVDFQVSRDFGGWLPYAVFGVEAPLVTASRRVTAAGVDNGAYVIPTYHGGLGVQMMLPAKLAFQVDLHGAAFSFSVLLAQRF